MAWFKSPKLWLLLVLSGVGVGWYLSRPLPVKTVEATKTGSRISNKVTDTITKTIKPDGTVIEKKQSVTSSIKEKEHQSVITKELPVDNKKAQYRIGVDYLPSLPEPPNVRHVEIRAAARVGESPVWVEGGYDLKHNQIKIGVSVEF